MREQTRKEEGTNPEGGGVFNPTMTSLGGSTDSPETDGKDGRNQQRSRAEEKTPEPRRLRRQQHDNPYDTLWDGQEAARQTDRPHSGKSVA
ncbi:hypothetical protein NDU88_001343 [Pleurodeles waltl]|uniref:Uncharacterized protein n=1 Tax=Pleurodeles waltl TaxID=8319 RepID=A0AAV7SC14_PLEWA|nr:hypothetical protein NDU88_001343 [Pleurodeles waltl]